MPYKILPDITGKQNEIVGLIYKFRFINRKQIQELLGHKDARRVNAWLKDLVEKKYLGRIYSHKLLENTKPAIYYLETNGIALIQWNPELHWGSDDLETKHVKKFYEDKHASETFRNHCVFLCDIFLQLKRIEKSSVWEYEFITKSELITYLRDDPDFSEKRKYMPDVHIYKVKKTGEDSTSFMLELFDPHTPRYALRYKAKLYLKLHEEGDWSDYDSIDQRFPKIIFILPTKQTLKNIAKFIQEELNNSYDVEDVIYLLTTYEYIQEKGIGSDIWTIVSSEQN